MTCLFEALPYEVLDCITAYMSSSKSDLRQLQLVNKLCQFVAEKYLFKELTLSSPDPDQYKLLVESPQRCSSVKILMLTGLEPILFDINFSTMFQDIERVCNSCEYEVNWQNFHKIFSPKKYRLKEIPCMSHRESDPTYYAKSLYDHSPYLEKLKVAKMIFPTVSTMFIKYAIRHLDFPQLKSLSFSWVNPKLQDFDVLFSKYPLVEDLKVFSYAEDRVNSWIPIVQKQRLMRRVSLSSFTADFLNLFTYFVAKFPNVQKWKVNNHVEDGTQVERDFSPFEEYLKLLHFIMKSKKVEFDILTTYSSIPKFFDFLGLYDANSNISINYKSSTRPSNCRLKLVAMVLQHSRTKSILNEAKLVYVSGGRDIEHFNLLEKYGCHIRNLEMQLPSDSYDEREELIIDDMLQGGALAHLLDNCPELISLKYRSSNLFPIGRTKKAHKNLKQVALNCHDTIRNDTLESLSKAAPNIEDLVIEDGFDTLIPITMPNNSFKRLVLKNISFSLHQNNIYVLIKISLLKSGDSKHYIQKQGEGEPLASISQQEYDIYSKLPDHTSVVILCQSIDYLECRGNAWPFVPNLLIQLAL